MPLIHSSSPSAFRTNVKNLMGEVGKSPHVQSRSQALAVAYATKRRGRADGGAADADFWTPNEALRAGLDRLGSRRLAQGGPDIEALAHGKLEQMSRKAPGFAPGGFASPMPSTPWQVRAEARGMHTGPILSAVAGRTDHHPMSVPAGSYVLPADHVSSMGQGNTVHGMAVLNHMFHSGPYGGQSMGMRGRGMGIPRAPLAKFAAGGWSDAGGARGSAASVGKAVPINAAGGEFVIPPHVVAAIGGGNIKHGHAILDHWVVSNRKNHISTLKKLPGPAKS